MVATVRRALQQGGVALGPGEAAAAGSAGGGGWAAGATLRARQLRRDRMPITSQLHLRLAERPGAHVRRGTEEAVSTGVRSSTRACMADVDQGLATRQRFAGAASAALDTGVHAGVQPASRPLLPFLTALRRHLQLLATSHSASKSRSAPPVTRSAPELTTGAPRGLRAPAQPPRWRQRRHQAAGSSWWPPPLCRRRRHGRPSGRRWCWTRTSTQPRLRQS